MNEYEYEFEYENEIIIKKERGRFEPITNEQLI